MGQNEKIQLKARWESGGPRQQALPLSLKSHPTIQNNGNREALPMKLIHNWHNKLNPCLFHIILYNLNEYYVHSIVQLTSNFMCKRRCTVNYGIADRLSMRGGLRTIFWIDILILWRVSILVHFICTWCERCLNYRYWCVCSGRGKHWTILRATNQGYWNYRKRRDARFAALQSLNQTKYIYMNKNIANLENKNNIRKVH